jgi:5'-phosphate synthase pdxT subunit
VNIGIVGYQGDVSEHVELLEKLDRQYKREINVVLVKSVKSLSTVSGLIIPGGESTTMYRLIKEFGLFDAIRQRGLEGMPIMGTCAGLIIISNDDPNERVRSLGLLNVQVRRNAYGRQAESFFEEIDIDGIGKFNAVFIRAPQIEKWNNVTVLAKYDGMPVMVKDGNIIGLTFHPELTEDPRIHEMFLDNIRRGRDVSTGDIDWPLYDYV